ncbi:MAG: S-methyl-5-thioribose-1-phosphate isomerase [Candidatus Aenigmarchaeota archaeon]|nr:S-methyl-5-thioribose-1-phosphate isomerase [Candidatus Aenigmarchaeota archaeon]
MLVGGKDYKSVWFDDGKLMAINQEKLPSNFEVVSSDNYSMIAGFIRDGTVSGSSAVGVAAAFGIALASIEGEKTKNPKAIELARDRLLSSSPVYCLKNCVERVYLKACVSAEDALSEAKKIYEEVVLESKLISENGSGLIKNGHRIATHGNAGWLSSIDWGTVGGSISTAREKGREIFVFVGETRPFNRGSRLTAWELKNGGIDHAIIIDDAFAHFMQKGDVDMVMVGADRIFLSGNAVNTIGTLEKAIAAKEFGVPFYVAASMSAFDRLNEDGNKTTGEEAPSKAWNPEFDLTLAKYITGIVTPHGIIGPKKSEIMKLIKTF